MRLPALRSPVPFQRPVPSPQGQAASETPGPRAPRPGGSERALGASAQPALRSRTPAPAHAGSCSGPRKQPPVWAPSGPAVTNAILWHGTGRPLSAGWAGRGRPARHRRSRGRRCWWPGPPPCFRARRPGAAGSSAWVCRGHTGRCWLSSRGCGRSPRCHQGQVGGSSELGEQGCRAPPLRHAADTVRAPTSWFSLAPPLR